MRTGCSLVWWVPKRGMVIRLQPWLLYVWKSYCGGDGNDGRTGVCGRIDQRQDLLDAFPIEVQPPGTHGFSSMMTATMEPSDWEFVQRAIKWDAGQFHNTSSSWKPDPGRPVRVAIQRWTALHARSYFPGVRPLKKLRFEMEAWEMLARYLAAAVGR